MWEEYTWVVVCGAFLAFFVAYGIGANDVANAFGSSVGSKAITIKQALVIAAIFEFAGAVLLGANVTSTVRKGIADYHYFIDAPELYMYGMLCVLLATGIWLILASYYELPVSTTHSTVGGVIGFSICAGGPQAVLWYAPSSTFPYVKGVSSIVLSWVLSPVLSGLISVILFLSVRTLVLRSQNSYQRSWWVFPILVFITVLINAFFIIFKGASSKLKGTWVAEPQWAACLAAGLGLLSGIITAVVVVPLLKKRIDAREARAASAADEAAAKAEAGETDEKAEVEADVKDADVKRSPLHAPWESMKGLAISLSKGVNHDVHQAVEDDETVHDIHEFSEKFDPKTEESFKYLQVFTAICDSFSHGANDVANSVGPFAAIWTIYKYTGIAPKSEVPIWILVLGGFGIVIGLATYGYKIMCAIGVKMCRITPTRGFAIELGAAVVIVAGSRLGIPLSTTHCQVGATIGVGLLESVTKGVNWKLVGRVVVGWVVTLIVVGFTTAGFFAQGAYAPSMLNINERNTLQYAIRDVSGSNVVALNQTVYTSQVEGLNAALEAQSETAMMMFQNEEGSNLYAQAIPYMDSVSLLTESAWTVLNTTVPLSGGILDATTLNGTIFWDLGYVQGSTAQEVVFDSHA